MNNPENLGTEGKRRRQSKQKQNTICVVETTRANKHKSQGTVNVKTHIKTKQKTKMFNNTESII